MCLGVKILLIIVVGWCCYLIVSSAKKANVKNMDDFRHASLLKKINMIFTQEEDLLHVDKRRGLLSLAACLILLGYLIVSCFK